MSQADKSLFGVLLLFIGIVIVVDVMFPKPE